MPKTWISTLWLACRRVQEFYGRRRTRIGVYVDTVDTNLRNRETLDAPRTENLLWQLMKT